MNVQDLRDRILEISHDEATPDSQLKNKALAWLNSAYHELVGECLPYLEPYLETVTTLDLSTGQANLPSDFSRVLTLVDSQTGHVFKQVTQKEGVSLTAQKGANGHDVFWISGQQLYSLKTCDAPVQMVYLKQVPVLTDQSTEQDIILPVAFHHALVWGGLVWSSIFERGFSTQSDLKLFQQKWDEAKREVKLLLATEPLKDRRVQGYDPY